MVKPSFVCLNKRHSERKRKKKNIKKVHMILKGLATSVITICIKRLNSLITEIISRLDH